MTTFDPPIKLNAMKTMLTVLSLMLCLSVYAQDNVYRFQATNMKLNVKGEPIETSTSEPTVITVNLAEKTLMIETTSSEVTDLMKGQMSRPITNQMGDIGPQYSLEVDNNIFAHFYLDGRQMIMLTRNDIHPLEWGMMFKEVEQVD